MIEQMRTSFLSWTLPLIKITAFTAGLGSGDLLAVPGTDVVWKTKRNQRWC